MSGGMWRPAGGHCAVLLSCPNRCECGEQVKAELALLDEQNHDGTDTHEAPQSPAEADSEPHRGIRARILSLSFTRGNR